MMKIGESWKYGGGFKRPGYYKKGEEGPIKNVGRKNDPDKVMYIACVGNSKGKGVKVALEPAEQTKELKRGDSRTGSKKGDKRKVNANVDGKFYAKKLNKILGALIKHADFKDADTIYVQDDNAPAHKLSQECVSKVWDKYKKTKPRIVKQTQPPKSPDLNVCDMRVFSWMQQQIDLDDCEDRKQLQKSVKKAWKKLSCDHIGKMFKKKTDVCKWILQNKGNNLYRNF